MPEQGSEPLFPTPTELGAIAYRLDAIAAELSEIARVHDYIGVDALARRLWGAMDDLVAYGMRPSDDD